MPTKQTLLLTSLFLISCTAYCQPFQRKVFYARGDLIHYSVEYYVPLVHTTYLDQSIKTEAYSFATGKLVEEFIRYSDSSFIYILYDSNRTQIQKGLIVTDSSLIDIEQPIIPDWKKDPDGSKGIMIDTVFRSYGFAKAGYWIETDSSGITWAGYYEKNKRIGMWEKGTMSPYKLNVEDVVNYVDGNIQPVHIRPLWPAIKGIWYIDVLKSTDKLIYLSRSDSYMPRAIFCHIINPVTYQYECRDKGDTLNRKNICSGQWVYKDDLLTLYGEKTTSKYIIKAITDAELILQVLQ